MTRYISIYKNVPARTYNVFYSGWAPSDSASVHTWIAIKYSSTTFAARSVSRRTPISRRSECMRDHYEAIQDELFRRQVIYLAGISRQQEPRNTRHESGSTQSDLYKSWFPGATNEAGCDATAFVNIIAGWLRSTVLFHHKLSSFPTSVVDKVTPWQVLTFCNTYLYFAVISTYNNPILGLNCIATKLYRKYRKYHAILTISKMTCFRHCYAVGLVLLWSVGMCACDTTIACDN